MQSVIYEPLEEFEGKYRALHQENTRKFFDELVKRSGVDIAQNRKTVKLHHEYKDNLKKLKKKLNWLRFWRVLMCISLILIPLVILKMTPKIRALRQEIADADQKADELLAEAGRQMQPLNLLFTKRDALDIIETTLPLLSFAESFDVEQEVDMKLNYDYRDNSTAEQSTVDVLAGRYNDNPFLFENTLIHTMGTQTYHGSRTIFWTETYRDSNGRLRTRTRSQTLHASVTKPKPFYNNRIVLTYCAQGAPELHFSRDASRLDQKSERELKRIVKRGEKKLKKKTDEAIKNNTDFMSMSNSEFEVLFDALDRTDEVQFRTLFTPLAQTNMVELILSKAGFGDDFHFVKTKRTNKIVTNHSQGRALNLMPCDYFSHSYDEIASNFMDKNTAFFKAVYFDFAPLWSIPAYQERPVHSLDPLPDYQQLYSLKESEVLANAAAAHYMVHPDTKTKAILKSSYVSTRDGVDTTTITAHSYDIEKRVDMIPVFGGDGRFHNVPVEWDDYLPLVACNSFCVSTMETAQERQILSGHNGLCMFKSE